MSSGDSIICRLVYGRSYRTDDKKGCGPGAAQAHATLATLRQIDPLPTLQAESREGWPQEASLSPSTLRLPIHVIRSSFVKT